MTIIDTIEGALQKDDWWKQLVTLIGIPAILSFFAYTYVIGWFLASDIAWFPFFTLSDHARFAVRALPLVAAASIIVLTMYPNWKQYSWLAWLWVIALVLFATWALFTSHITMATIIGLMVWFEISRRLSESFIEPSSIIYLIVNLMVLSIIAGFISASTWMYLPLAHLRTAPLMTVHLKEPLPGDKKVLAGRAMFAGEKLVLFYEHRVGTHLLRLEEIQHIEQCLHGKADDKPDSKHDECPDT
jgi:hypothetical protein